MHGFYSVSAFFLALIIPYLTLKLYCLSAFQGSSGEKSRHYINLEYFDILSEAGIKLSSNKSSVVYSLVSSYLQADAEADEKKALKELKRALEPGANPLLSLTIRMPTSSLHTI